MFRLALAAALLASPALAQDQSTPARRYRSVEIKKGQPCPRASSPDEVVVCHTLDEPYRIPQGLRDEGDAQAAASQSWVNRAQTVDQVSRVAGGLPDTCSPVGTGGQSGCALQQNNAYAAERRAQARTDGSGSSPQ